MAEDSVLVVVEEVVMVMLALLLLRRLPFLTRVLVLLRPAEDLVVVVHNKLFAAEGSVSSVL